ncbi:fibronectin type III domain-containing protein, partial [Robiginitalea sp.]|nr:fibronectin type III domain-containing protein [Robiginitalea sp.]
MNVKKLLSLLSLVLGISGSWGQEIHLDANAASIVNEANDISGWTGNVAVTSVSTDPIDGNFALQIESTSTGQFATYSFTASVGVRYAIRIWARQGIMVSNPPSSAFANWQGFTGFVNTPISTTDWTAYDFYLTASNTNPQIRVYTGDGGTAGTAGNTVLVDGVSITPAETQAPSAVADLVASNTTASSTQLSWSPATDNVGVTNYQIFQNGVSIGNSGGATSFSVSGLLPGTTYNFTVIAEDAAENISTESNIAEVTTFNDLNETGNATSVLNEANGTVGWSGDVTLTSVAANPADGDFALQIESTATGRFASYSFSTTVGVRYAIRIWARLGAMNSLPPSAAFANWQGFGGFVTTNINNTAWAPYDFYYTANASTAEIRIYTGGGSTAGTVGNTVFVDGVSITLAETEAPSTVFDLSAANTTATTTDLSWTAATDNVGVTDYEIFRDGVSMGNSGGATTFSATGLLPGTTYNFTVVAEDAAGNTSASSNSVQVITPEEINSVANATSIDNEADDIAGWTGNVDLSSTNTDTADGLFALQIVSTPASQFASYSFNATVGLRYAVRFWAKQGAMISNPVSAAIANWQGVEGLEDTPIASDWTEYEIYVNATTATPQLRFYAGGAAANGTVGNTILIDGLSIRLAETEAPSSIIDLAASNITATTVDLNWSAATDNIAVVNYEIYQDGVLVGNSGTTNSFTVTGLLPGGSYNLAVAAVDAAGNSSTSNTVQVSTPNEIHGDGNAASVTNEVDGTAGWSGDVIISSVATGAIDGDFALQIESSATGRFASYSFNATVGVLYTIRIWARQGNMVSNPATPAFANWQGFNAFVARPISQSNWTENIFYLTASSATPELRIYTGGASTDGIVGNTVLIDGISITPAELEAPAAITDLSAENVTDTSLDLTWTAATDNVGVANYEIFQDGVSIGNSGTDTTFSVGGLTTSTSYVFTVFSRDAVGNVSESSNELTVTTVDVIIPTPPSNLVSSNLTDTTVDLNWDAATDNVGIFNYEILQDGVSIGSAGTETSYSVSGLTTATTYEFTVVTQDAAGNESELS